MIGIPIDVNAIKAMYTILPPNRWPSRVIENKEEATVGASERVTQPKVCARPLVAPRAALFGALFTMNI